MKKMMIFLAALMLLLSAVPGYAQAPLASRSYTYDLWQQTMICPDPYTLDIRKTGHDLGVGELNNLNDIFLCRDGTLYVAVSGVEKEDNFILHLDGQLNLISCLQGYTDEAGNFTAFSRPAGVFCNTDGTLYIADALKKNILHMDEKGNLIRLIPAPTHASSQGLVDDAFTKRYTPSRLVVDPTGRIHVVAVNVNEGIVEFDQEGKFTGFLAAGKVQYNAMELFWRRISTDQQLKRMNDFVPVEYNNIALDEEGFLFVTLAPSDLAQVEAELRGAAPDEKGALVRRLNMLGSDILDRDGYGPPSGDYDVFDVSADATYTGVSKIVDVACGENGTYALLDNNRKHIFVYNNEGYLLYAFSGPDVTAGGVRTPSSIEMGGGYLYVLDAGSNAILAFRLSAFGKAVNDALSAENAGEFTLAGEKWQQVLDMSGGYDLAYRGLGKTAYQQKDYKTALAHFEACGDGAWYSKAYMQLRKDFIARYTAPFLAAAIGLAAVIAAVKISRRIRKKRKAVAEQ